MAPGSARPVRTLVLSILARGREDEGFADEALDDAVAQLADPRDRGLARELTLGVVRRRLTLDAIAAAFSSRPVREVEPLVREALRLGVYQSVFLERVPAHAAVDATVEAVRDLGRARACGFVNAVLRAVLAARRDPAGLDPRCLVPVLGRRRVGFVRPVLPDPAAELEHLSAAYSYPVELVRRWLERFGREQSERLLDAGNHPPPVVLRVNRLRANREQVIARLAEEGVVGEPGVHPLSVAADRPGRPVADMGVFVEGWASVQDATATAVVDALAPQPGERILDLCAAPGGKSAHIAEAIENRGTVVACDVSEEKLASVMQAARRLGITCIKTCRADRPEACAAGQAPFDRVLVDVPCSNTGVLARRVEARYRPTAEQVARLSPLQTELLGRGADRLRPGGTLVYSTCSLEREENRELVSALVGRRPEFRLLEDRLTMPEVGSRPADWRDGGYWAKLTRG